MTTISKKGKDKGKQEKARVGVIDKQAQPSLEELETRLGAQEPLSVSSPEKRGRGRPKGSGKKAEESPIQFESRNLVKTITDMLSKRAHFNPLTDAELDDLAPALDLYVEKKGLTMHDKFVDIYLCAVLTAIFFPRIEQSVRYFRGRRPAKETSKHGDKKPK